MFITGYFAGLMKVLHLLQINNKGQILHQTIAELYSVLIIHFEIAPVGMNRWYHWAFGCRTKLSPQAKKSASPYIK
jgi:hypothetical protein